jgi:hypothetical protein
LAVQEEEERQAKIKAEKEELRRQEEDEEARRKAKLEQDIRIAQLLRKQREHEQAKADEKFAQEAEERRKANREKRLQEHYKSQAWRIEQERSSEQMLQKRGEEKKRGEEAKMQERKRLFNSIKAEQSGRVQLSGWMSVQSAGTVTWRRRWYTFDEKTLKFFKAQNVCSSLLLFSVFSRAALQDTSPVDVITVSDIRDVRDCGDVTEEEPAFIPNSFVIEELHGCCWSLFTDTQEAMVRHCPIIVYTEANHGVFTGENNGCNDLLLGRPQEHSFPKVIPHWPSWSSIRFSHSPLIPGPGCPILIALCLSSTLPVGIPRPFLIPCVVAGWQLLYLYHMHHVVSSPYYAPYVPPTEAGPRFLFLHGVANQWWSALPVELRCPPFGGPGVPARYPA